MKIKKIADSFELPKDIVLGIPIVTCYGSDQMTIENHKGILEFNDKYINVRAMKKFTEKIREKLSYMPYAELIFLSAKTGQRLPKLFDMIDAVIENCALRVQTGVLNEILTEAMAMKQPPSDKGKRLRIYYITQVSVKPPTFVMFINEKKLTHFSYRVWKVSTITTPVLCS